MAVHAANKRDPIELKKPERKLMEELHHQLQEAEMEELLGEMVATRREAE